MPPRKTSRKVTKKILELIEEGVLDAEVVVNACLKYMSEADVLDMAEENEFLDEAVEEEEEDEDDDDDEEDDNNF